MQKEETFLTELPTEISFHVLGFLKKPSLARSSLVCRSWHNLVDSYNSQNFLVDQSLNELNKIFIKFSTNFPAELQNKLLTLLGLVVNTLNNSDFLTLITNLGAARGLMLFDPSLSNNRENEDFKKALCAIDKMIKHVTHNYVKLQNVEPSPDKQGFMIYCPSPEGGYVQKIGCTDYGRIVGPKLSIKKEKEIICSTLFQYICNVIKAEHHIKSLGLMGVPGHLYSTILLHESNLSAKNSTLQDLKNILENTNTDDSSLLNKLISCSALKIKKSSKLYAFFSKTDLSFSAQVIDDYINYLIKTLVGNRTIYLLESAIVINVRNGTQYQLFQIEYLENEILKKLNEIDMFGRVFNRDLTFVMKDLKEVILAEMESEVQMKLEEFNPK
jgi:hypothetical protein